MALQIIAWTGSGLFFSIFPIETIRGEHLTREPEPTPVSGLQDALAPDRAWEAATVGISEPGQPVEISLVQRRGETWYQIVGTSGDGVFRRLVHAQRGHVQAFLDADGALALARHALVQGGLGAEAKLIDSVPPDSEIRGRDLPVWQVSYIEPESLSLYFDPWTGELLARRTTRWRIFDFLWMLHIMDFDERDDFNTPLLQTAAALALLVAFSGLVFWAMTSRLFRRRRVRPA